MGKAVISIDGNEQIVDDLRAQMLGKDIFKDYAIEVVKLTSTKVLIIVSDINMDRERIYNPSFPLFLIRGWLSKFIRRVSYCKANLYVRNAIKLLVGAVLPLKVDGQNFELSSFISDDEHCSQRTIGNIHGSDAKAVAMLSLLRSGLNSR